MNARGQISEVFSQWIDAVAARVVALGGRLTSQRVVRLVEEKNGVFALREDPNAPAAGERLTIADGRVVGQVPARIAGALQGSRVDVALQPERFLFRPLELPSRAAEFIDGVVRAQIDRLTPWNAADAAFGWTKPTAAGPERIAVTVAATARTLINPVVQALTSAGAASVALSTVAPGASGAGAPITVLAENTRRALEAQRVRRALVAVLVTTGLLAAATAAGATVYSGYLSQREQELARRVAERRAAMIGTRDGAGDPATAAHRALERRKHESPLAVLVIETLSRILPDHTYVTELRIEGDKLRLVGISRDAPSLIGLIEQSGQFSRATFFAPTTRSPTDPGERFHIEARIEPNLAARS